MFWRKRRQDDFNAEIEAHLQLEAERLKEQGLSEEKARMAARRAFGNVTLAQERFYESGRWLGWDRLVQDFRFGLRQLRKNPGFAAVAVLTLALGIGANTAIFSAVRAVLIEDLPYPESDQVVVLREVTPSSRDMLFCIQDLEALRQRTRAFSGMAAYALGQFVARGAGEAEQLRGSRVSADFFTVFGVAPSAGRLFGNADFTSGARSVVISHAVWRQHFGGAPDAVGRTLWLNREPWTVVGVMPAIFDVGGVLWIPQVWTLDLIASNSSHNLYVVARLGRGVDLSPAQASVDLAMAGLRKERPSTNASTGARVARLSDTGSPFVRPTLLLLQGMAGLLLLIACANLANLFLARATDRRREFGVRAALGACRWRLIRQMLIESLVVATIGGTLGVMISYWTVPALVSAAAWTLPRSDSVGVRLPELAFGLGLGILTALVFGIVPAMAASRSDLIESLRGATHATSGRGTRVFRSGLVAAEVCLALVVLAGASLMIKSVVRVISLPMGFDPRNLVVAEVPLPNPPYADEDRRREFRRRLANAVKVRLDARPIALANSMPYTAASMNFFTVPPLDPAEKPTFHTMPFRVVSENYFDVLRIPLLQGRLFMPGDVAGHDRVAIVNEQFVRDFGGGNLVGRRIMSRRVEFVVVGVVGDTRNFALTQPPEAAVYAPLEQEAIYGLSIAVRGGDTATIVRALAEAVMTLDPDLPVLRAEQVGTKMKRVDAQRGFYLLMLSLFAGLGAALAAVGIYGVMAHVTGLRTRELGVRIALGAQSGEVRALVLRQGLRPVLAGLAAGLVGAWWVTHLLRANTVFAAQLFQVTPHDPWTLASALVGLLLVAAAACWIPARRTRRIDPVSVLRAE